MFYKAVINRIPLLLMGAALAGCVTVGPDYEPPEVAVPEQWAAVSRDVPARGEADEASLSSWWNGLGDPVLAGLVERALSGNHDLKTAVTRVRESRARLGVSEAARYPALDATASARQSTSESKTDSVTTQRDTQSWSIGLDASWEIDLFGGTWRAIEAAQADLASQEEALHDVQVTLAAEVALTYIRVREYQRRIAITGENLSTLREEAAMVRAQRDSGLASELDLIQAEEALVSTEAQLPGLHAGLNESLNALAILLGETPGALNNELGREVDIPTAPLDIAAGVPADLLRRRPDVRGAERALAAETARVGVAASELYPKLSLTGSFIYEELSADTDGLSTTTRSQTAGIGPSVRWPIFSGGSIRRNMEAQDARQEQALIAYEQTVLNAIGEVENALFSFGQTAREVELLGRSVDAAREVRDLRDVMYQSGLDDFVNFLTAWKNLLSLEDRLVSAKAALTSDLIRIYKALGGGWMPQERAALPADPEAVAEK